MSQTQDSYTFEGFSSPNFTQVPDEFFDELAPNLGEAELRVLLYMMRRTFGFKKISDDISLSQLVNGITRADGSVLDHGAGVAKSAAARALHGLVEKGVIEAKRNQSRERGFEATTYTLRFRRETPPLSSKRTRGSPPREQALVLQQDIQETGLQETVEQQTASNYLLRSSEDSSSSNRNETHEKIQEERVQESGEAPDPRRGFTTPGALLTERLRQPKPQPASNQPTANKRRRAPSAIPDTSEYAALRAYMKTLRVRFHDFASEQSSTTRAYHLFQEAHETHPTLDISTFTGYLEQAAALTAERGGQLRYWFSVLEDLLWPKPKQPRRDTSGYNTPRRRKAVGGPYVRVAPLLDDSPT